MNKDQEYLRLITIFHYVVSGITALFACFPIIHLVMGIIFMFLPMKQNSNDPFPGFIIGLFFVVFASIIILMGWALAFCIFLNGRYLSQKKHYTFCLVVACVECIFMPFGTVLGVFTIILLMKDNVKALFQTTS